MTIIQPKIKSRLDNYVGIFIALLLVMGMLYIYEYNHFVSLRHEIGVLDKEIIDLQAKDSDLKNELYALISPAKLEATGKQKGLVIEKNPDYLNIDTPWASTAY